jgi:hypothetical protein
MRTANDRRALREGQGGVRRQGPPQAGADRRAGRQPFECDDVLVAVGQENAFPWIERDAGIEFDDHGVMPVVDKVTFAQSTQPRCSSAAMPRSARRTSSGPWRTGTTRRYRSTSCCTGEDIDAASAAETHVTVVSQKMGIHEWSYDNEVSLDLRFKVPHRDNGGRSRDIKAEVELGFDVKLALGEAQRCLNCDVQTVFSRRSASNAMPASTSARWTASPSPRMARRVICVSACKAPALNHLQDSMSQDGSEDRPRHGQGRRRLPALRSVRRALSDRRLGHAEVPPRESLMQVEHATV